MKAEEIKEGDIVEIDYIEEYTKEHINEGKALVIWKGFNYQPLVRKLDTKTTIWTCYEHIAKVVGHTDIEGYMDKALEQKPCEDAISRQAVLDCINDDLGLGDEEYGLDAERLVELGKSYKYVKSLPSVTPQSKWIPAYERLPEPNRLVLCDITTGVTETYFLACWNDIQNDWEEGIGGYRLLERDLGYKVIEWQPLPELYRGGRI